MAELYTRPLKPASINNLCFLTEAFAAAHFHNCNGQRNAGAGSIPDIIAIAEGLFTEGPQPRLIGGRFGKTGRIVFPCPTGDPRYAPEPLPSHGTVWSWTIQRFRPKSPPYTGPSEFQPFAIAYVELPGAAIVEGLLIDVAFDAITIGMEVETVIIPHATDAQGRTVMSYAFAPVQKAIQNG